MNNTGLLPLVEWLCYKAPDAHGDIENWMAAVYQWPKCDLSMMIETYSNPINGNWNIPPNILLN